MTVEIDVGDLPDGFKLDINLPVARGFGQGEGFSIPGSPTPLICVAEHVARRKMIERIHVVKRVRRRNGRPTRIIELWLSGAGGIRLDELPIRIEIQRQTALRGRNNRARHKQKETESDDTASAIWPKAILSTLEHFPYFRRNELPRLPERLYYVQYLDDVSLDGSHLGCPLFKFLR